jgi:NAD(P)-dependent dehydrogenase (short-subunit alcohol dehydrogenase family)
MKNQNKSAFITGANRGLGKGFVKYFIGEGIKVFAGVRNLESVDDSYKNNPLISIVKIDVSDDSQIKDAVRKVSSETNSLTYLINNAGMNKDSATNGKKELVCNLNKLDRKSLLKMFDVNSVSPTMVTKAFLNLLKNEDSFVINISSCRASIKDEYQNSNGNYGYRSSKAALNTMTLSSLFDLPKNVKTFAVHPGGVLTDMNPRGDHDAQEQAEKIVSISNNENWREEFNGQFLRYNGMHYPL